MNINEKRIRQLRKIRHVLHRARELGGRPASGLALLCAAAALVLTELFRYALQEAGFADFPWWVTLLLTALAYLAIMQSARHKTYTALVCDLLAVYEPMNVGAYRALQEETGANGLSFRAVERWLEVEWDAIQPPRVPPEQQRFVDKQIGPRLVKK